MQMFTSGVVGTLCCKYRSVYYFQHGLRHMSSDSSTSKFTGLIAIDCRVTLGLPAGVDTCTVDKLSDKVNLMLSFPSLLPLRCPRCLMSQTHGVCFGITFGNNTLFVVLKTSSGFMSVSWLLLYLCEVHVEILDSTFLGGEEIPQV